jgi:hypothetical protein
LALSLPEATQAESLSPWRVSLDLQVVTVSPEQAQKLIPRLRDAKRFGASYAELQQMIERDEAELIAWPVLVTRGGERAVSESVVEERYPTESESVGIPQHFGENAPPDQPSDLDAPEWDFLLKLFEVRDAGVKLQSDCTISGDGQRISLYLVPQWIRLLGFHTFSESRLPCGIQDFMEQPEFFTSKVTEEFTIQNGDRILLGAFTQGKARPQVALFLLKASAVRIDRQPVKP